jgi:hypothetical protein
VNPYTPAKVTACLEKMAPYRTIYTVRNADDCIAAVTLFEKDKIINTYGFGIDFERAKKNRAYFNLLYYNTIKEMIARKAGYFNFNPLAYKVKESRGCDLVQQFMYARVLKGRLWMKPWLALVDRRYRNKFQKFYAQAHAVHASSGESRAQAGLD